MAISPELQALLSGSVAQALTASTRPAATPRGQGTKGKRGAKPPVGLLDFDYWKNSGDPAEAQPYLDSTSLFQLGDRLERREGEQSDRDFGEKSAAAEAARTLADTERSRVEGNERVTNTTAARGLRRSSIRDAGHDATDAAAARVGERVRGDLALLAAQNLDAERRGERSDRDFQTALGIRATENAQTIPLAARRASRRKRKIGSAGNVRGAATLRRQ